MNERKHFVKNKILHGAKSSKVQILRDKLWRTSIKVNHTWQLYKSTGNNPLIVHTAVLTQCHTRLLYHCLTTCVTYVYFQTFYEDFFIGLRWKSPPLPEIFTVPYYTMILQRPSVIVEDAAFEPRTSAPRSLMRYHWATTSHNCFKIYF